LCEEEELVGQPHEVRAAHTPRFILVAFLANYPKFHCAILESKQFKHVFTAVEDRALLAITDLWEQHRSQHRSETITRFITTTYIANGTQKG
jgi:hypothetical protein